MCNQTVKEKNELEKRFDFLIFELSCLEQTRMIWSDEYSKKSKELKELRKKIQQA